PKWFARVFHRTLSLSSSIPATVFCRRVLLWASQIGPEQERASRNRVRNPTNAVGGLFIASLQSCTRWPLPNPTNAVDGLFILSLTTTAILPARLRTSRI